MPRDAAKAGEREMHQKHALAACRYTLKNTMKDGGCRVGVKIKDNRYFGVYELNPRRRCLLIVVTRNFGD